MTSSLDRAGNDDGMAPKANAGKPASPGAHLDRGNALKDKGELNEAIAAYRRAIALDDTYCEAHSNLGLALLAQGNTEEAITACRRAIALRPEYPEPYLNFGLALRAQRNPDEAIVAFRTAISRRQDYAEAYFYLGETLRERRRLDEAMSAYERAIACKPDYPTAHLNLANMLYEQGKLDKAIAGYSQAITLKPDFVDAHSNLGNALRKQGKVEEAIAACRQAIAIQPDFPAAHLNLSLALLLKGDFSEGWREYEWRWRGGTSDLIPRKFLQPRWQGEDLTGKTLLLHAEQGLGDTLQFARFAPVMANRAAKIILAVQPPLVRLLSEAQWPNVTVNNGAELSGFDVELPLMSLPAVLGMTEATIPADVPYLAADAQRVEHWRERLPKDGFKIGIVWQGRPEAKVDPARSFPLRSCAPLSALGGVTVISLQKRHGLEQLDALPGGMRIETLGADFDSGPDAFLDSAAVMMNLDLVITADTATAHLAGALARPTWIALSHAPEWRWLMQREDSPWYPTARLFRQRRSGDWDEIFERMAEELSPIVSGER
jgi:tetratricopeptide (TPR) repeat protein